jgi:hypothetical protein
LHLVIREEKKKNSPYRYQHYQSLSNVVAENNLQSLKS